MICSKCGYELNDDMIFCPKCGTEVSIVPEFIPEVEISIEESIQDMANELSDDDDGYMGEAANSRGESFDTGIIGDDTTSYDIKDIIGEESLSGVIANRFKLLYICLLGAVLLGLVIFLSVMIYRDNSATYQIGKGDKAFDAGYYKQAVSFYEKAIDIDPANIDYRIKLADCYVTMDNTDMAIEVYKDLIIHDPDSTLAYAQVIALYESNGAYDAIDDFLQHYANDNIRSAFVDYLAYPPVFSEEEGDYDEAVILTLTSETTGTIYYTEDGTDPSESSPVYTEPLYLKKGSHVIKAFFKNEFGVCSSVKTCKYGILAEAPSEPIVSPEDGEYTVPQLVRIIVPEDCRVYYTLDGSEPDTSSRIYGEPIPVSDGITQLKCIAYNSKNIASDVVERNYRVTVLSSFTPEAGLMLLNDHLASIGYIADNTGTSSYYPGKFNYMYTEMRYIGGRSLYCYNEYYLLGTGVKSMTSNVFALDVITGECFLVKKGTGDTYSISPF